MLLLKSYVELRTNVCSTVKCGNQAQRTYSFKRLLWAYIWGGGGGERREAALFRKGFYVCKKHTYDRETVSLCQGLTFHIQKPLKMEFYSGKPNNKTNQVQ